MDLLAELGAVLPEDRVVFAGDDLEHHAGGVFTYHTPVRPDAVVYPQGRDEVVEILRFANAHRIPIVPFGQGSHSPNVPWPRGRSFLISRRPEGPPRR